MSATETDPQSPPPGLLEGYRPAAAGFDELLAAGGHPREHWQTLLGAFGGFGPEDVSGRREAARRILREHGVTYNIYGDARGFDRPWALDLMPLLIRPEEWRKIEAGLEQRARLLNALLADFYGPQQLLARGGLPPALLHANPGFLRPCHGIRPPRDGFLFLHAVDLARAADGRWWVLADRTQAPSGAGYALENRIVLARVLPDEFRDCQVHRLAGFFQQARDTLRSLAPSPRDQPNVVVLTPGPYNETYFEQAFLARYLGFPLVEGGDLTMRDRRIFIKTLQGLQPVDVILRRVDDAFCDPLELRPDSMLGVPGLVEAARAGRVTVANALGTGAVEAPALMSFFPGLCRQLLGEDLQLPGVATWWCGQEKEFAYVRDHLGDLVIKRAFQSAGEPVFGARLNAEERSALLAGMAAEPFEFVGQEQLTLSTAPVWERGQLEPRPMVLRAYIAATPDGYTVMPGGLTRFSSSPDRLIVSMQSGGGSKDTWVLADGPVSQLSLLLPSAQLVRLERAAAEVPSRVAENLYWLGRHAERLEDTVRVLRCVLNRFSGEGGAEESPELAALIRLLVNLDLFPARFRERYSLAGVEREIHQLIYQVHRLGTVREVLGRLKNNAFVLRDRFSADTWRILGRLQVEAPAQTGRVSAAEALRRLDALVVELAAFSGMEMENMTRGLGWRFLDIGRRLERAVKMTTLLQGAIAVEGPGTSVLEPVLEIADSMMTYRRRYFAQPHWPNVLELLLADEANPRSLAFQVAALAGHAASLPAEAASPRQEPPIATLRAAVAAADLRSLAEAQLAGRNQELTATLARFAAELRSISDGLTHHYFSHAVTRVS